MRTIRVYIANKALYSKFKSRSIHESSRKDVDFCQLVLQIELNDRSENQIKFYIWPSISIAMVHVVVDWECNRILYDNVVFLNNNDFEKYTVSDMLLQFYLKVQYSLTLKKYEDSRVDKPSPFDSEIYKFPSEEEAEDFEAISDLFDDTKIIRVCSTVSWLYKRLETDVLHSVVKKKDYLVINEIYEIHLYEAGFEDSIAPSHTDLFLYGNNTKNPPLKRSLNVENWESFSGDLICAFIFEDCASINSFSEIC